MIKEQIMQTAFDLFSQYGIKSVSMDDISKSINISKRTIYELFDDKETLLIESMQFNSNNLWLVLEKLEKESYSALEVILFFYEEVLKTPRWYSRKFYDDLKRYPKAKQQKEQQKADFSKKCIQLFNRGVKEGVFKVGVNIEIVALLAKEQSKMLKPSQAFSNYSCTEVFNTIIITFLRGVSTEKGIAILDRFALKQSYNIQ